MLHYSGHDFLVEGVVSNPLGISWSKATPLKASFNRLILFVFSEELIGRKRHWYRLLRSTRFFSCKNELYKNVEAENCRKFKNVLRMFRGSNSNKLASKSFLCLHKWWWCLLFTLDFYVNTILATVFHCFLLHYDIWPSSCRHFSKFPYSLVPN
jgi:hypothetical protein